MGGKELGFTDYEQSTTKKLTKREKFLYPFIHGQCIPSDPALGLLSSAVMGRVPA